MSGISQIGKTSSAREMPRFAENCFCFHEKGRFQDSVRTLKAGKGGKRREKAGRHPELVVDGIHFSGILESMKTTIDIPEKELMDAMRFAKAKTKREAVVKALEEFNRRSRVEALIAMAGTIPDFPTNDEIEKSDIEDAEKLRKLWED